MSNKINYSSRDLKLFFISFLALFLEIVLIRWISCEVRIFAYFKNLVLISCFLGLGIGLYTYKRKTQLDLSLMLLTCLIIFIVAPFDFLKDIGPLGITKNLNIFSDFQAFRYYDYVGVFDLIRHLLFGIGWTVAVFFSIIFITIPFGRLIGKFMSEYQNNIKAYTIHILGSLLGILSFTLLSLWQIQPWVWFFVVVGASSLFLKSKKRKISALILIFLILTCFYLYNKKHMTIWSVYQKLEVKKKDSVIRLNNKEIKSREATYILVNNITFQWLRILADLDDRGPIIPTRFVLPYALQRDFPEEVLIVGSGAGNDVGVANDIGISKVVAVEIDPAIYRISKRFNNDKPYDNKNVLVVIDDARNYIQKTKEKFDLIVFSHLDAHTLLSGYTNVRLDNYIYTVESLKRAKELLTEDGLLYLSFWSEKDWLTKRLYNNLQQAFGYQPYLLIAKNTTAIKGQEIDIIHFLIASNQESNKILEKQIPNWPSYTKTIIDPQTNLVPASTDDWPFLYIAKKQIPSLVIIVSVLIMLISIGLIRYYTKGSAKLNWHFFFLGAGFLLLEVHNVSKLALAFGTTWIVNTLVISSIFLLLLLANLFVYKVKKININFFYLCLIVSLGLLWFFSFSDKNMHPNSLLDSVFINGVFSLPFIFAGIIFANSFKQTTHPSQVFGSNMTGAILGGLLGSASFITGIRSLIIIVICLYFISYFFKNDLS